MSMCKKFKPSEGVSFVSSPAGDCSGCVYFSSSNCGMHRAESALGEDGSFFSSRA